MTEDYRYLSQVYEFSARDLYSYSPVFAAFILGFDSTI